MLGDGRFRYIDPASGDECNEGPLVQRIFRKGSSQDWIIPLVQKLVADGQQIIVFRETKSEARSCAKYLADALRLTPAGEAIAQLPMGDPSSATHDLRTVLQGGIAFHNADLDREERRIIEEEFRREGSGLRVIAATTTLAMGINTPASSVIVCGLNHPGDEPYSVAEYKNLVGRAGRLGYAESGSSYLIALDSHTEHDFWTRYVTGAPEDLASRFLDGQTDPRSLIIRVLVAARKASGEGVPRDEIIDFLESSFGAFQATRRNQSWQWDRDDLLRALNDLLSHALVERRSDQTYQLTNLGSLAGEAGVEVASIISLVSCLRSLPLDQISDPVLVAASQTTVELDQMLFPINRKSTQKEPQVWPSELQQQGVPWPVLSALQQNSSDQLQATLRAKKAVACLLFVSGEPMSDIEGKLTQFGGAFGGAAGPIRSVAARTCDLLPTAARVAEILHPALDLNNRVGRLVIRLTYGVSGTVVDLARETGAGLLRGDYRRLELAGLYEPDPITAATDDNILACVDGDREKLALVRDAAQRIADKRTRTAKAAQPILNTYVA